MAPTPELVVHRAGPATLEDALRDLARNAPYLAVALLVHLVLLLILATLRTELPVQEETGVITGAAPVEREPLPPREPDPVPPMETPQLPEDDPTPVEDSEPLPTDHAPSDASLASLDPSRASLLGMAGGWPEGTRGPAGQPSGRGPVPPAPTAAAVLRGLQWLAHHQDPGGHWSAADFADQCGRQGDDTLCDGAGNPRFDVGVSGLALLAFLGAGHTDRGGRFQDTVKRGLRYLVDVQRTDGELGPEWSTVGTYDHIVATLALCEAYARSQSSYLREPARRALQRMYALRTPGSGWRYRSDHPEMADPARRSDTSVTGWALLAMSTARKAGLPFDDAAYDEALLFLDEVTDPLTGRTGYLTPGGTSARERGLDSTWPARQSEALTAVAVLCRVFADPEGLRPEQQSLIQRGAALIAALPPLWSDDAPGRRDFYYWYYGAYAIHESGDESWRRWSRAIEEHVMAHQHERGERTGSWDPQLDPWGHLGGRVYATAILTLTLEVYFRYDTLGGR